MKSAIVTLVLAALMPALPGQVREIDAANSKAAFSVSHIWVEHVTGRVPILSGNVVLPPGSLIPVRANAVLAAAAVVTGDPDRDRSLKSPDFFDARQFPTWTFTSTSVTAKGSSAFEMMGDLTIHGVTQQEVLNVSVGGTIAHPTYHATTHIDRHAFGMTVTRLDPTIGATVDVTLDVALK
ncbi:MAG: YceI family protein [Candidatus Eremiobacteraeota bacterium]|nr:YceI family protein [Candidatus Eremiobacteraeota bacterium]